MVPRKMLLVLCVVILLVCNCSKGIKKHYLKHEQISGTWVSKTKNNVKYVLVFRDDFVSVCSYDRGFLGQQMALLWVVDDGSLKVCYSGTDSNVSVHDSPDLGGSMNGDILTLDVPIVNRFTVLKKVSSEQLQLGPQNATSVLLEEALNSL